MKKWLYSLSLAMTGSFLIMASDLTIVFSSKAKGPLGMSSDSVQTHYYNAMYHKTEDAGSKQDTLVSYEKEVVYTIKHKDKKIEKMTFDDLVAMAENGKKQLDSMGEVPGFLKNIMGGDGGSVKVEAVGPDKVAERNCKKFKLSLGKMQQEVSMDENLHPPVNPKAYARFMKLKAYTVPGNKNMAKMYEELSKLKGMALRVKMTGFMGMDSTLEATKVSQAAIPAPTFALPAGYKTEDVGKKLRKQMEGAE